MSNKYTRVVFKDVYNRLLMVREQRETGIYWGLPGGKQEEGETLEECAERECWEELGVIVTDLSLHSGHEVRFGESTWLCNVYTANHYIGEPKALDGVLQVKFMELEEIEIRANLNQVLTEFNYNLFFSKEV